MTFIGHDVFYTLYGISRCMTVKILSNSLVDTDSRIIATNKLTPDVSHQLYFNIFFFLFCSHIELILRLSII